MQLRSLFLTATVVTCGAAACGKVQDRQSPDAPAGAPDGSPDTASAADAQLLPASCRAIHDQTPTAPSGPYRIDPDGAGPDAPLDVTCDMTTAPGGWTLVFIPPSANIPAAPTAYTAGSARLMADAESVLLAYRDASLAAFANHASFPIPADWRAAPPFAAANLTADVAVSIDNAVPINAKLVYGHGNFGQLCQDPWSTDGTEYGRVCIWSGNPSVANPPAPFYSAFNVATPDLCSKSSEPYSTTGCSADLMFTIAVR